MVQHIETNNIIHLHFISLLDFFVFEKYAFRYSDDLRILTYTDQTPTGSSLNSIPSPLAQSKFTVFHCGDLYS